MAAKFSLRPATRKDAVDLAILMDMASRGLLNWMWSTLAEPGQSALEVGRDRILTRTDIPSHYSRWRVAEHDGAVAGGYAGYVVPESLRSWRCERIAGCLWALARVGGAGGGMLVSDGDRRLSRFSQGGIGLDFAQVGHCGRRGNPAVDQIMLTVSTANENAFRLYERHGFRETDRRPAVPFPGSGDIGEWLLLERDVS